MTTKLADILNTHRCRLRTPERVDAHAHRVRAERPDPHGVGVHWECSWSAWGDGDDGDNR